MIKEWNRRKTLFVWIIVSVIFLTGICIVGIFLSDKAMETDFSVKNLSPCFKYPFGTDYLGRDMLARTVAGLSASIVIGVVSAVFCSIIALILGIGAAMGKWADTIISFIVDLIMSIPQMLLLILVSVCFGKGLKGVCLGIILTHWTSLARVIRAEVLQLKQQPYIKIAAKLGKGRFYIAFRHILPHLFPQFAVGIVLMFPHAILHEASITFLGLGLSNEQPAIGIILSEAMKYLISGKWWLAFFPGMMLVLIVVCFYAVGENLRKLLDPSSAHD